MYPTCILQAVTTLLFVLKSVVKFSSTLATLNQGLQTALSQNMIDDFASASQRWVENASWKPVW